MENIATLNENLLLDAEQHEFTLEESIQDNQKFFRIRGKFATIEKMNVNRRIYPRALWEREVAKYQNEIENGTVNTLMEWEHPVGRTKVDPKNAVAKIEKLWIEGDYVMGEAVIFDTQQSETIKNMIRHGVKISVSSRATGGVGAGGVVSSFNLITFDIVTNPSDQSATMSGIFESEENSEEAKNMADEKLMENLVGILRTKNVEIRDLNEEVDILRDEIQTIKNHPLYGEMIAAPMQNFGAERHQDVSSTLRDTDPSGEYKSGEDHASIIAGLIAEFNKTDEIGSHLDTDVYIQDRYVSINESEDESEYGFNEAEDSAFVKLEDAVRASGIKYSDVREGNRGEPDFVIEVDSHADEMKFAKYAKQRGFYGGKRNDVHTLNFRTGYDAELSPIGVKFEVNQDDEFSVNESVLPKIKNASSKRIMDDIINDGFDVSEFNPVTNNRDKLTVSVNTATFKKVKAFAAFSKYEVDLKPNAVYLKDSGGFVCVLLGENHPYSNTGKKTFSATGDGKISGKGRLTTAHYIHAMAGVCNETGLIGLMFSAKHSDLCQVSKETLSIVKSKLRLGPLDTDSHFAVNLLKIQDLDNGASVKLTFEGQDGVVFSTVFTTYVLFESSDSADAIRDTISAFDVEINDSEINESENALNEAQPKVEQRMRDLAKSLSIQAGCEILEFDGSFKGNSGEFAVRDYRHLRQVSRLRPGTYGKVKVVDVEIGSNTVSFFTDEDEQLDVIMDETLFESAQNSKPINKHLAAPNHLL